MEKQMKKSVTWWEFLGGLIAIIVGLLSIYVSLKNTIREEARNYENHEQRLGTLENNFREFKIEMREGFMKIADKQDKMSDKQEQTLIILQNKKDRDK